MVEALNCGEGDARLAEGAIVLRAWRNGRIFCTSAGGARVDQRGAGGRARCAAARRACERGLVDAYHAELVAALPETKRALVRQRLLDYLGTNQNLLDMYLVPSSAIMKKMEMPILP